MTIQNPPYISAHADPEGESPWAMQIVVKEDIEHTPLELANAVSIAVLNYLATVKTLESRFTAVKRWKQGRIRKVLRRAKNARWDALEAEDGVLTKVNNVEVRVFTPTAMDEIPRSISKCQVSGLKTSQEAYSTVPMDDSGWLNIYVNRSLKMSPAKAAVAAAHSAQLMSEMLTLEDYNAWKTAGFPLNASSLLVLEKWLGAAADVSVFDGGLTEVEPGSLTSIGIWTHRE